jgi:hypothetical protein
LLNWLFALLFTALLFKKKISRNVSAILGAAAISNSLLRFVPMLGFLIQALMGQLVIEDEVSLGFKAIFPDRFPMRLSDLKGFLSTGVSSFLSNPRL